MTNSMTFYMNAGQLFEYFCGRMKFGYKRLIIDTESFGMTATIEAIVSRNICRRVFVDMEVMRWYGQDEIEHIASYLAEDFSHKLKDAIAIEQAETKRLGKDKP